MRMLYVFVLYAFIACSVSEPILAQSATPPSAAAASAVVVAPLVAVAAPAVATVAVAEPAAPPQWAIDLILTIQKLPIIGPIVTKAMVYAGIIASILTALVGCLLTVFTMLSSIASFSGLAKIADAIKAFRDGKIMYWLTYFSIINAQKPTDPVSPVVV